MSKGSVVLWTHLSGWDIRVDWLDIKELCLFFLFFKRLYIIRVLYACFILNLCLMDFFFSWS